MRKGDLLGRKAINGNKRIPPGKRLQVLKALSTIPCVLVKMAAITQHASLYRLLLND